MNQSQKWGALLVSVFLIMAVATGCTFTGAKDAVDEPASGTGEEVTRSEVEGVFQCGDYEVQLPQEYLEELVIQCGGADDDVIIDVSELASIEAGEADGYGADYGLGWLFSIARCDRVAYERMLCEDVSGRSVFAKDDQWYYVYAFPTDVRYYRSEQSEMEHGAGNWAALNDMGLSVCEDFIARNGLTAFNGSAIRNEYTYAGEHRFVNYYPNFYAEGSTDEVWQLVLSQPVRQGPDGIWCVERMYDSYGNVYLWFPDSGMPAEEYYAALQAECDAEGGSNLLSLGQACIWFIKDCGYFDGNVVDGSLEILDDQ